MLVFLELVDGEIGGNNDLYHRFLFKSGESTWGGVSFPIQFQTLECSGPLGVYWGRRGSRPGSPTTRAISLVSRGTSFYQLEVSGCPTGTRRVGCFFALIVN